MEGEVYICECCGREHENRIPFPEGCPCGNHVEDFFRIKDLYDVQDERRGVPLVGINYDPSVLQEREEKLKGIVVLSVVTATTDGDAGSVVFEEMSRKQLMKYLKEGGVSLPLRTLKTDELVEMCKKLEDTSRAW